MDGGLNNILAVATGLAMVSTCSLIFIVFQKKLFNKYRNKVRNAMDKARSEAPVFENEKV